MESSESRIEGDLNRVRRRRLWREPLLNRKGGLPGQELDKQPDQRRGAIYPSRPCGFPPIVLERQHSGNACETPGDLSRIGHPKPSEQGVRIKYGGLREDC